ncbi:MAG: RDD family protein [Planctomycetales bacterium]|nr:RDD family protein [Planctomycetales bacterium]
MPEENPYAAPVADFSGIDVDATQPDKLRIASQGKRFANLIVDQFAYYVFSFLVGLVMALVGAVDVLDSIPDLVFGILVMLVYFVPQEAIFGRTLGKLITGTKVVDVQGRSPTFGQVIGRTLARMIPFEAFSFFGGKGYPVGWHDSLSKTRVVTTR